MLRAGMRDECEAIALEARAEIGLRPEDRFDPEILVAHLGIELKPLESYRAILPSSVRHLTAEARNAFSAVTVYRGEKRLIVYNQAHSSRRHANTIAHELAHILLEHEPTPLFDEYGCPLWIQEDETEANYLAGALLVPLSAVAPVMDQVGENLVDAAEHFGVSESLMQHRVYVAADPVWWEMSELDQLFGGKQEASARPATTQVHRIRRSGGDGGEAVPRATGSGPVRPV